MSNTLYKILVEAEQSTCQLVCQTEEIEHIISDDKMGMSSPHLIVFLRPCLNYQSLPLYVKVAIYQHPPH